MVIGKGSYVRSGQVEWFWWMTRLQHPPKPPTVFGARCVSRSPMKYLKHVLKLHVQCLPEYCDTRYIHPLLARTRSPKYN